MNNRYLIGADILGAESPAPSPAPAPPVSPLMWGAFALGVVALLGFGVMQMKKG